MYTDKVKGEKKIAYHVQEFKLNLIGKILSKQKLYIINTCSNKLFKCILIIFSLFFDFINKRLCLINIK